MSEQNKSANRIPVTLEFIKRVTGPILNHDLEFPAAIVSFGNSIYVADIGAGRIYEFDTNLNPNRQLGNFKEPYGLTINSHGEILVTDYELDQIIRLDRALNLMQSQLFEDSLDAFKFGRPGGVTFGPDDEFWISDRIEKRIAIYDRFAEFKSFTADIDVGGVFLRMPGSALKFGNQVFVADEGKPRVVVFNSYANAVNEFGGNHVQSISGLSMSRDGALWVADSASQALLVFSSDWRLIYNSAYTPSVLGEDQPVGITVVNDSTLVITEKHSPSIALYRILYE